MQIVTPLTNLLRKDAFKWTVEAQLPFQQLKEALRTGPVLVYPNFDDAFIVETDVCDVVIGTVLTQHEHPITYFSKKLSMLRQRM